MNASQLSERLPDEELFARLHNRPKLSESEINAYRALVQSAENCRWDPSVCHAEVEPRFFLAGRPFATVGGVSTVTGQAKLGKSSFLAAMVASRIAAESGQPNVDCLGLTAVSDVDGILLHVDTEQAPADHSRFVQSALRRGGVTQAPSWLESFGLAGQSPAVLLQMLRALLWEHSLRGIYGVLLDGIGDFVSAINDERESKEVVTTLQQLAIAYRTAIVVVLHENPGIAGGKARGHLGSELERKSEAIIQLRKSGPITSVFSEKIRRAPILESDGPRFAWSDVAQMHVSVVNARVGREAEKRDELRDLAEEVFGGSTTLRFSEVCTRIQKARGCAEKTAQKFFTCMKKCGVITHNGEGTWSLKT